MLHKSEYDPLPYQPDTEAQGTTITYNEYESTMDKRSWSYQPILKDQEVKHSLLRVFIPYDIDHYPTDTVQKYCDVDPIKKHDWKIYGTIVLYDYDTHEDTSSASHRRIHQQNVLDCFQKLITFTIDSDTVDPESFSFYTHHKHEIPGFLAYFKVAHLKPGKHTLTIRSEKTDYDFYLPFIYNPAVSRRAKE